MLLGNRHSHVPTNWKIKNENNKMLKVALRTVIKTVILECVNNNNNNDISWEWYKNNVKNDSKNNIDIKNGNTKSNR